MTDTVEPVPDILDTIAESKSLRRVRAYGPVLEKTDRIVSNRGVAVSIDGRESLHPELEDVPAWTDGEVIHLNGVVLEKLYTRLKGVNPVKFVTILKGANYHELCHVIYTPRRDDEILVWIESKVAETGSGIWRHAFNVLEDQRIEMMFTTLYRPSIRYFESMVLEWILTHAARMGEAHGLVHGRKYLNDDVRAECEAAFAIKYGAGKAQHCSDIIDEYLTVVYPTDLLRAKSLISKFVTLLQSVQAPESLHTQCADNNGSRVSISNGRAQVKDQRRAKKRIQVILDAEKAKDGEDGSGLDHSQDASEYGEGNSPVSGDPQANDDGEKGSGAASGEGTGEADGGLGESDTPSNGTGGQGAGTGDGSQGEIVKEQDLTNIIDRIIAAAEEAYEAVQNDPELLEDVKATVESVRAAAAGSANATGKLSNRKMEDLPEGSVGLVRNVKNVLQEIQKDLEPTWLRRESRGRINMRRAMLRQPNELDIYDRWNEGLEEEGGVEFVLLTDQSGSMDYVMGEVSLVMWAMKRAFDDLGFRSTVIGYSDSHYVIYRADEKAPRGRLPMFGTYGGTHPDSAMKEAARVLSRSQMPNRVLVTLTDGQWSSHDDSPKIVTALGKQSGTHTMLIGLNGAVQHNGKLGHHEAHDLETVKELPKLVKTLVGRILRDIATG